jgi:hypothetical protein
MSYSGPGDVVSGALYYGGLNAYNATYASPGTNPCADLRRLSDSATMTMNILATGAADVATAQTWVGGSSAVITKLYDQTGNSHHVTQATTTQQPALTFGASGLGSNQPAITFVLANNQFLTSGNVTQLQPMTMAAMVQPTVAENAIFFSVMTTYNGVWMQAVSTPTLQINGGTALNSGAITTGSWYRSQGVFNGASSGITVNGTTTSGNAGTQQASAVPINVGGDASQIADAFTGSVCAVGLWPSAFNSTQLGNMDTNLQYWLAALPSGGGATLLLGQQQLVMM